MANSRFLLLFFGLTACAAQADGIMVAEFRADQPVVSQPSDRPGADTERADPGGLYTRETGGSQERSWQLGGYTLSGVMDWGYRTNYLASDRYNDEQYVTLGSRMRQGEHSETYLYHGLGWDRSGFAAELYGEPGDAESTRTGLEQNLYFADDRARVGVGYEYATGDREQRYESLEGHEVNVSGQLQLGWGFSAHLRAAYGLYSYGAYDGVRGDLSSSRRNMRAGISRSFTPDLTWGLNYSYIDEEFGVSDLSETRHTWGLNLKYQY